MSYIKDKCQALLRDNRTRSILKAISYRIISVIITILISWFITRSYRIAFAIGGFDVVAKIVFYYVHERIWHRSTIGRVAK